MIITMLLTVVLALVGALAGWMKCFEPDAFRQEKTIRSFFRALRWEGRVVLTVLPLLTGAAVFFNWLESETLMTKIEGIQDASADLTSVSNKMSETVNTTLRDVNSVLDTTKAIQTSTAKVAESSREILATSSNSLHRINTLTQIERLVGERQIREGEVATALARVRGCTGCAQVQLGTARAISGPRARADHIIEAAKWLQRACDAHNALEDKCGELDLRLEMGFREQISGLGKLVTPIRMYYEQNDLADGAKLIRVCDDLRAVRGMIDESAEMLYRMATGKVSVQYSDELQLLLPAAAPPQDAGQQNAPSKAVVAYPALAQTPNQSAPKTAPQSVDERLQTLEASMKSQELTNAELKKGTTTNLFDRLLPVLTFLGGFLLSQLQHFRDLARERKNLRFVLSREVREIYRSLNRVVAPDSEKVDPSIVQLVALMGTQISTKVYDDYFSKISILKPRFVQRLYDTYSMVLAHVRGCQEFQAALATASDSNRDEIAAKATVVVSTLQPTYEKITALLNEFHDGASAITELKSEHGEAISRFQEINKLLGKNAG